jgi:dTDP-4-dehydrorhamnose reductase
VTILVLGAGGQVGRALVERAEGAAVGLDRTACDISDPDSVARAMTASNPSIVVNCAGYTAVDRAESERDRAFAVNARGVEIVARETAKRGVPVIHLSTDYVYAGTGEEPHREDDPIAPINVYGASKAAGDAALAAINEKRIVLRVSWVFGAHGANFVKTIVRLGRERSELRIVDDQIGGPTEARDIADAILSVVAICCGRGFDAWGVYHFAGAPSTSWYGFACAICENAIAPPPHLIPIASREYPTPAKRPLNSILDCEKIRRVFGIKQPDWRIALSRVLSVIDGVSV